MDHETPVPDLVAEALHQDPSVGGQRAGGRELFGQIGHEIVAGEAGDIRSDELHKPGRLGFPQVGADRLAHLVGAALRICVPEGEFAGPARGGGDQHAVMGDLLDAPRRCAQRDHVAHPRLVDHLLVEFADPGVLGADDEHGEQATVGDRPARNHRRTLGALARGQHSGGPVPHQSRSELREVVGRVPAGQHVQDSIERRARKPCVS